MGGIQLAATSAGVLWDDFGSALAGRQVYVYKRDTTTQINIYSDEALTTLIPGGQPLTTQADGSIPGYAAGDIPFDFVDAITSKRRQGLEIGLQLWPSGGDDTTAIISAQSLGKPLGKGTFLFSGAVPCPLGQGQALTILKATAAAACILDGPAVGTASSTADQQPAGNFKFDGNAVATGGTSNIAVLLNRVNWRYDPIKITNLPANVDALVVAGQNLMVDKPELEATGTGFCLAFDNGAGGNNIRNARTGGGNQIEFRETSGAQGYGVPSHNVIDTWIGDQPNTSTYGVRHRAGFMNVIRDSEVTNRTAAAIIKFENQATVGGYTGGNYVNGRLQLSGKNSIGGNNASQYGIWCDYVSGGVAAAMTGDVGLVVQGELNIANVDLGDVKWGSSTPVIWTPSDLYRQPVSSTRPFWTANGTNAAKGPNPSTRAFQPRSLWMPTGAFSENFDRRVKLNTQTGALTSGLMLLAGGNVIPAGMTCSNITIYGGATASATITHTWFALYDQGFTLLGVTADSTSAIATHAPFTLAMSTPVTVAKDTGVYVGIVVNATTMPNLDAVDTTTGFFAMTPNLVCTGNSSLTTGPAGAPSTASVSASLTTLPYCYLS